MEWRNGDVMGMTRLLREVSGQSSKLRNQARRTEELSSSMDSNISTLCLASSEKFFSLSERATWLLTLRRRMARVIFDDGEYLGEGSYESLCFGNTTICRLESVLSSVLSVLWHEVCNL